MTVDLIQRLSAITFGALVLTTAAYPRDAPRIDRNVTLWSGDPSNSYPPGLYHIVRADNGDYVVAGATNLNDTEAWAVRVDSSGRTRWQYINGAADSWKESASNQNRFNGALILADNSTVLCGTTHVEHKSRALIVHISADGKLLSKILLVPKGYEQAQLSSCLKWGVGFAFLGMVSEPSTGSQNANFSGWLCKLTGAVQIVWNRFDPSFQSSDAIDTPDHHLLVMTSNANGTMVSRVDANGVVVGQRDIPGSDAAFMRPLLPSPRVRVGYMVDTFQTEFVDFDQVMQGPAHTVKVNNVGIKKGFELADGSLVVFGSTFVNNARPNVARVYKDSRFTNFAVAADEEGGWVNDAVPGDSPNQYVTVRSISKPVMSWVSFGEDKSASPVNNISAKKYNPEASEWPTPPEKRLDSIKRIPPNDQIVLEVRYKNRSGVPNEIGVFDLTKHRESKWDVLSDALREIPATSFGSQAAWAPAARKLLYATHRSAYLVSTDGSASELHLQMPGTATLFDGMSGYAISADGLQIAYTLLIRDQSQKSQVQGDSLGRLYTDLVIQRSEESPPISVWNDGSSMLNSAWRPDGAAIAHTDSSNNLVVSDLGGKTLWSVHAGAAHQNGGIADAIQEIHWDPTGQRLAFLMGIPIPKLFVVNADGTGIKEVDFRNLFGADRDHPIAKFAWSPDGRKFVFRSQAGSKCNYLALGFKIQTGHYPCIYSWNLSTADADGSHVSKAIASPDYEFGELFWIQ